MTALKRTQQFEAGHARAVIGKNASGRHQQGDPTGAGILNRPLPLAGEAMKLLEPLQGARLHALVLAPCSFEALDNRTSAAIKVMSNRLSTQRKRISGRLAKGARSLLLTTSDAQTWIVDALDVDQTLVGKSVIVDGISTAADRIKADWIGCA